MELPHLGRHCSESTCRQLDYLPVKCDSCFKTFCSDHFSYSSHNCVASYQKDVQVPVCPLCNEPVPGRRDEQPDIRVSRHIDQDCQSDPARTKRKIYTNKCSLKGCKQKELIKMSCSHCQKNFCLRHRHFQDHDCSPISSSGAAAVNRNQEQTAIPVASQPSRVAAPPRNRAYGSHVASVQAGLSEDEALAMALNISLTDPPAKVTQPLMPSNQEEADRQLAEALAASERLAHTGQNTTQNSQSKDKCSLS